MQKLVKYLIIAIVLSVASCAPRVIVNITTPMEIYDGEVKIFDVHEAYPENAVVLGTVKITDSGVSTDCAYATVIRLAEQEVRKAGGNAFKLTRHTLPDMMSTCDRIEGMVLKTAPGDQEGDSGSEEPGDVLRNAGMTDHAMVYLYRLENTQGMMVNYVVNVNDSAFFRMRRGAKCSLRVDTEGEYRLWARTGSKDLVKLDVEFGKSYYIRCGVGFGLFVGTPVLEEVDAVTGKREYRALAYVSHPRDTVMSYSRLRIQAATSAEYRLFKIADDASDPEKELYENLKSGTGITYGLTFFMTEFLGLGFRYNCFNTESAVENVWFRYNDGTTGTGEIKSSMRFDGYYPTFSTRMVSGKGRLRMNNDFGVGLVKYHEASIVGKDDVTADGDCIGYFTNLGLDFILMKNLALGVEGLFYIATLSKAEVELNGVRSTENLNSGQMISLSRYGIGITLSLSR